MVNFSVGNKNAALAIAETFKEKELKFNLNNIIGDCWEFKVKSNNTNYVIHLSLETLSNLQKKS